jgi:segregation and condensation protein B
MRHFPRFLPTQGQHPLAQVKRGRLPANHRLPAIYQYLLCDDPEQRSQDEGGRSSQLALVEAALFAADEPLTPKRIAQAAGLRETMEARRLVRELQALYDRDGTAFQVEELGGGFQLLTRQVYHSWLLRLRQRGSDLRLSPAARETLAIVAYRQPIMRAEMEAIRGVQCGEMLRLLMERGLVRITGRHNSLGRPVLYGTTKRFLQIFGLRTLKDLPKADLPGKTGGPLTANDR